MKPSAADSLSGSSSVDSPSLHSAQLQAWIKRIREGDRTAPDELLRAAGSRLESLARKMLARFPAVRSQEQTGDVLQSALIRLLRALREVEVTSVRDFFGLAAEQLRRELLDLARRYTPASRRGGRLAPRLTEEEMPLNLDDEGDLERWAAFHERVAALPAEEREVIGLVFYHGWTQAEVAELFQVNERTVRRRWHSALEKLRELRGGGAPS
jgi:RNA polymerase sigma-70 factor (ECF subfamily)